MVSEHHHQLHAPPLTIGLITTEYVTEKNFDGGLANYLNRLALSLKELGHYPIVIIIVINQKSQVFYHQGIEIHRVCLSGLTLVRIIKLLGMRLFDNSLGILSLGICLRFYLKRLAGDRQFSILQYPSCAGLGLFRIRNIPSIIRISSYHPLWNLAYDRPSSLDVRAYEEIEKLAFVQADALFGPSHLIANAVQDATQKSVKIIETPFILETQDLDTTLYQQYLQGKKYLLFFGTIGLMKGCDTIAKIIYDVLSLDSDLYFVFVGKDKDYLGYQGKSLMVDIKNNAQEHQSRVIHFQRQPHKCLYPIIANAYAVVLPSLIDNFPNTCLEAMGHGKIVIGTEGSSFEQLISNGVSGFLCQKNNPLELLHTIETVLALTPGAKATIEQNAYQRIEDLQPEKVVNQLVDFYRQVINDFDS